MKYHHDIIKLVGTGTNQSSFRVCRQCERGPGLPSIARKDRVNYFKQDLRMCCR